MADVVDIANDFEELITAKNLEFVMSQAAAIPAGEAGECDLCGEHYARLVNGVCARCRDKRGLP